MSSNKFIMKIYFITNLMVFFCITNVSSFLYKFSQSSNGLISQKARIAFFFWTEGVLRNLRTSYQMEMHEKMGWEH